MSLDRILAELDAIDRIDREPPPDFVIDIVRLAAAAFGTTEANVFSTARDVATSNAKHVSRWLVRRRYGPGYPTLGRWFGCDHQCVINSIRRVNDARNGRTTTDQARAIKRVSEELEDRCDRRSETEANRGSCTGLQDACVH